MHNDIFYIHKGFILYQENLTLPRLDYSESSWKRGSFPIYYSKSLIVYAMTAMLTIVIDQPNNLQVIQKYQDDQQKLL